MIDILDKTDCTGCGACAGVCGKSCIDLLPDDDGFLYPVIDQARCVSCHLCEKACPVINHPGKVNAEKTFSAYANDSSIRRTSSSGGVFYLLAEHILRNHGVVFGAAFNPDLIVEHTCITEIRDLPKLQMSKYVQSRSHDVYLSVKQYLAEGRSVLFTGTPCQIAGLKGYLKKDYDHLYTQDIICHGVPSPLLWESHKQYIKNSMGITLTNVEFRNKTKGWRNYDINYIDRQKSHLISHDDDDYMKIYFSKICLRPSCYRCAFKGENRASDLTLGDFWGVEKVMPEMDDNKGTSIVFCNTEKGMDLFSEISDKLTCKEVSYEEAVASNPMALKSVSESFRKDRFYRILKKRSYQKTVHRFLKQQARMKKSVALKNDYIIVKNEKGALYAVLWKIVHRHKYLA